MMRFMLALLAGVAWDPGPGVPPPIPCRVDGLEWFAGQALGIEDRVVNLRRLSAEMGLSGRLSW